jgi:signal transduction histidine kinase
MQSRQAVNILLVDDQPAKLMSYEAILQGLQENLIKANSGKEALDHLLRTDIAVVLVDVCMPELDGFELAAMIRSHPRYEKTAIILVSGVLVEDVDRLKGYDSGAVDYISVPVVPELLRAKVSVFADLFRKTGELERLNQELERRVEERTAEISLLLKNTEEARRESERANRLKDEFLATLSHELRAPLNAITGWAHMLRYGKLDAATQIKAVEAIDRNALLQAQLVSDLLDVSRIVSGKLRLELKPLDVVTVVQAALDMIRPTAEAKDIQIDAEMMRGRELVSGDQARLHQVVSNLLSNAVKFTPARGRVEVRLEDVGAQLELTVKDNGPGIRPDFLPYIFERFRQGDSTSTRSHQGLGLGLAIVRHLVEMHGGQVEAGNCVDSSGAIFKVSLPTLTRTSAVESLVSSGVSPWSLETATHPHPVLSLESVRVLVVDDEADSREVVAMVLERAGAEVRVAASASEALAIVGRELPDVLVADIEMPGEDGYSLVQKIRSLPADSGGQTPAVALTAHAGALDRAKLLEAGFNRHVPKPVRPPDLIAVIAQLAVPSERRVRSN